MTLCTVVVHILNKDISYDSKLKKLKKISHFGVKYSNSVSEVQIKVQMNDLALLLDLFGNSEGTKLLIFNSIIY